MEAQSVIFVGHGSPTNAVTESRYRKDVRRFAESIPKPDAIVCVSAHWEQRNPISITATSKTSLIYDFYGFPEELYQLTYDCPGAPSLAEEIKHLLGRAGMNAHLTSRGLDHGTWVPLIQMFPDADIPVVQVSMPVPRDSKTMYRVGQALAELRRKNVLLMASGNIVHNLPHAFRRMRRGEIDLSFDVPIEEWAAASDEWVKERLDNQDIEKLLDSKRLMPNFEMVAPTTEHYDPIYFLLGARLEGDGTVHFHEGFQAGSFSMRCVALQS